MPNDLHILISIYLNSDGFDLIFYYKVFNYLASFDSQIVLNTCNPPTC